jgi:hypothetical protein
MPVQPNIQDATAGLTARTSRSQTQHVSLVTWRALSEEPLVTAGFTLPPDPDAAEHGVPRGKVVDRTLYMLNQCCRQEESRHHWQVVKKNTKHKYEASS